MIAEEIRRDDLRLWMLRRHFKDFGVRPREGACPAGLLPLREAPPTVLVHPVPETVVGDPKEDRIGILLLAPCPNYHFDVSPIVLLIQPYYRREINDDCW